MTYECIMMYIHMLSESPYGLNFMFLEQLKQKVTPD